MDDSSRHSLAVSLQRSPLMMHKYVSALMIICPGALSTRRLNTYSMTGTLPFRSKETKRHEHGVLVLLRALTEQNITCVRRHVRARFDVGRSASCAQPQLTSGGGTDEKIC